MTLYREIPCNKCGVLHIGEKRNDPGAGCWAEPGGSREVVTVDYEAAARDFERQHATGAIWNVNTKSIVDAALHTEKEPVSTV